MRRHPLYTVLGLAVLALTVVPVGIAVFILGFVYGDSPCVMCWEQRIGMALVALTGLFVLRYGPRPRYIGLAVLIGAWGLHMGVRHSSLHLARDIGQGFSLEILGAHTYTWSVFIFWACVVTMGVLLVWLKDHEAAAPAPFRMIDSLTAGAFLVVIAANAVQAFASTGPPPYMGQGDPVRFSFNPRHWVWSLEEWDLEAPVSWRGRWAVGKPSLDGVDAAPATGPVSGAVAAVVTGRRALTLPLTGTVTDLAYDATADRFALTTQQGIYLADGGLTTVAKHTTVDPGFSVDLGTFSGVAFLDAHTVVAVSDNKSYVVLKDAAAVDPDANFRFFLDGFDQFEHVSRSRLTTVRARLMYVMSATYDPATDSLLTVSVPNAKNRRLVVSRFDRKDMTLSEEYVPTLAADRGLALGARRTLDEYIVTGAAVADGVLYALSAAHSTILGIDLGTHRVVSAKTVDGLDRPTGLAIKGDTFVIVNGSGHVTTVRR